MKITSINIPESDKVSKLYDNGLGRIQLNRLGNVVILAGKNGSGKTRILNKIKNIVTRIDEVIKFREQAKAHVEIESFNEELQKLFSYIQFDSTPVTTYNNSLLSFIPTNLNLSGWKELNYKQLNEQARLANEIGFNKMHESVFAKIQVLKNNWISASHPILSSNYSNDEKIVALEDFKNLNDLLNLLLECEIGVDLNNNPTLFGLNLEESKLSNGQKVLIQLCMAIHSQKMNLSELILFIDEPENHIHPSALIEIIDKIIQVVPNGQVWIATHSVSLLAHFSLSNIFFVDKGNAKHAGKIPEKILSSLLGNENEVNRLKDFIDLPEYFALNSFAFECLFAPEAIYTNNKDNQTLQINEIIRNLMESGEIKLLDYGAGKGRLLANIIDYDIELIQKINYIAYDKFKNDSEFCINQIKQIYNSFDERYYNDFSNLIKDHQPNSFDLILLCNVLHEISPKEWIKLFKTDGIITNIMSSNGYLLIVEDYFMIIGEKPHKDGYAVLDTREIMLLFCIDDNEKLEIRIDSRKEGRLKAHLIPKKFIHRISHKSVIQTLKSLQIRAKLEIEKLREIKNPNYIQGKQHAFWIHQLANTVLILENIEN